MTTPRQTEPRAWKIILLDRGEPAAVLGHAVKRRRGALERALRREADMIRRRWPEVAREDPPVEFGRHVITVGPLTICFEGAEP